MSFLGIFGGTLGWGWKVTSERLKKAEETSQKNVGGWVVLCFLTLLRIGSKR